MRFLAGTNGDFIVLGAGGKMGPSLSLMLRRACDRTGAGRKVTAVSRFSAGGVEERLQANGVSTVRADLTEPGQLETLPEADNVVELAAQKFGTTGREGQTWALNAFLPGRVAELYRGSKILHFSSGNVYPFVPAASGGSRESDETGPVGEYAQSRLGGERILEYFSRRDGTRITILRLNYAVELRYGVLHDVARAVLMRKPVDLRMGHVNVIWQRDANDMALRSFGMSASPPKVLNLTGPETVSVRWLANRFGELLGEAPVLSGTEEPTALLSNASHAIESLGKPRATLEEMAVWVADWLRRAAPPSTSRPISTTGRGGSEPWPVQTGVSLQRSGLRSPEAA